MARNSTVGVRAGVGHSPVAEGNCIRREAGWGATGGELAVRSQANPFRHSVAASLLIRGEARKQSATLEMAVKAMDERAVWLGMERREVAQQ
jgi:hypothetical protein